MMKTVRTSLAWGFVTVLLSACSHSPEPNAALSVATSKPQASNTEPIRAGRLIEDQIAFEFAVYYLPMPTKEPLGELDALLKGKFKDFKKVDKIPPYGRGKAISARLETNVKKAYAPPDLDSLRYCGRGLSKEQAEALQGTRMVLLLDFAYSQEHVWEGMRAALQLASRLARLTGGLLWDQETRELFTPEKWDNRRIADWTEKVPNISKHITIHVYNTGECVRAITLGMVKFGLPDIVIDKFSWSLNHNMGNLINLLSQSLAEGATIDKDGKFDLDIRTIKNAKVREPQLKSLKANATSVALLLLRKGVWEEGNPRNRLIEVAFDRYPGPDITSQQEKMLGSLFGWEDSVAHVKHDEEILAASRRARAKLPDLQKAFNAGLVPGEFILVKAPFETPDGGREWMWLEVTSWKGDKIKGLLRNEPYGVPNLHSGQTVGVSQATVFDYIRKRSDGTPEGNETAKIMKKNNRAAKDGER
jgi:uncharacterized protein YegJ (DUF2314 family)